MIEIRPVKLLLLCLFLLLPLSCTDRLRLEEKYDQLGTGMSVKEALNVMGESPQKMDSVSIAGGTLEKLIWCDRSACYTVTFVLGHLVVKERRTKKISLEAMGNGRTVIIHEKSRRSG